MEQKKPSGISQDEVVYWFADNWKPIVTGIFVIGLVGLFYVYSTSRAEAREQNATSKLFELQLADTNTVAEYESFAADFASTGVAQHAKLRAAAKAFENGDFVGAEQAYNQFVGEFSESPLLPEAFLGIAASLEAQGKTGEALTKYQEVTTRFPQSAVINRAKANQARLLVQNGEPEQAFRIYQDLTTTVSLDPYGTWSVEISTALRNLLGDHPELLQTNSPAAAVASPSLDLPALTQ